MSEADVEAPKPERGPGAQLRAVREAKGIALDALATQLKVAPQRLRALEDEAWDQLPDRTYARALATAVCRALGADSRAFLAAMPGAAPVALERVSEGLNQPIQTPGWSANGTRGALGLVLLAGLLLGLWWLGAGDDLRARWLGADVPDAQEGVAAEVVGALPEAPASAAAVAAAPVASAALQVSPPPVSVPTPPVQVLAASASEPAPIEAPNPAPAAEAASLRLALSVRHDSWVQAHDGQGQPLLSRLVRAGEQLDVPVARPPVRLVIGNAPGVDLVWRGQSQDLSAFQSLRVARLTLE
ncbi:cytoskeleton protein RodZ [Inhella inkyongensis]|uniref:Cytoskeleton protein RodZ n=1 Tax=Inhella inkyongensis TaxID=392593 RepID=A0A840S4I9_9BURK|nr:helix-turn-helix domain-containing protein [Inhella inkyongensis]MBB5203734.1 cytoskeleton protein RodZ [Inhella inkyongensis]